MWKDKKMWKMSIDVHGIVSCNLAISQCPSNVPLTGDFRSSETAWSRLGSRWNRNGSGAEFDVRHYECMRLSDEWCEWWVMSVAVGPFFFRSGKKQIQTNLERWSISSQHRFTVVLFAGFYVWTCEPLRLMRMKGDSWIPLAPQLGTWKKTIPNGKNRMKSLLNMCIGINGALLVMAMVPKSKCKPVGKLSSKFLNCVQEVPFKACFLWVPSWHSEIHTRGFPRRFGSAARLVVSEFLSLGDASGSNFGWILWMKRWLDLIDNVSPCVTLRRCGPVPAPGATTAKRAHAAGGRCLRAEGVPSPHHRRHQPCPGSKSAQRERSLKVCLFPPILAIKLCHSLRVADLFQSTDGWGGFGPNSFKLRDTQQHCKQMLEESFWVLSNATKESICRKTM